MGYKKIEWRNNEAPALNAKNLNYNEQAIYNNSIYHVALCTNKSDYLIDIETFEVLDGSILNVVFAPAKERNHVAILHINKRSYQIHSKYRGAVQGAEVERKYVQLVFNGMHFEIVGEDTSYEYKKKITDESELYNLNNLANAGMYMIDGAELIIQGNRVPVQGFMVVYGSDTMAMQIIYSTVDIYWRMYAGNPKDWGEWRTVVSVC